MRLRSKVAHQFVDVTTSELANVFAFLGQLSTPLTSEGAVESRAKTNRCLKGRVGSSHPKLSEATGRSGGGMNRAREDSDISAVGRGARLEGTLVSAGSLRVHGHLKGEISVKGEVVVSTDSVVEANITAGSISLAGRINGNLTAPGVVSLPLQSRVEGDAHAGSVTVQGPSRATWWRRIGSSSARKHGSTGAVRLTRGATRALV